MDVHDEIASMRCMLDIKFQSGPYELGRGLAGLGGMSRENFVILAAVLVEACNLKGPDYRDLVSGLEEGFQDYGWPAR